MIQFPSMVPVPKQFTILSNALLPENGNRLAIFRMHLTCTCGKAPYLNVVVESAAALRTVDFWQDLWSQMLVHEKAEVLAEGGTWQD